MAQVNSWLIFGPRNKELQVIMGQNGPDPLTVQVAIPAKSGVQKFRLARD